MDSDAFEATLSTLRVLNLEEDFLDSLQEIAESSRYSVGGEVSALEGSPEDDGDALPENSE